MLVPQSLAYAQLAGMPPYRGLYAAALPLLVAAFLASSPHLQTGPTALTALLTFGALSALAPPGSDEYVALGMLLALAVGAVRVMVGLLRAGVIAYLMSQPMLLGFVPAAGILIVASQLPTALGAAPPEGGVLEQAAWALAHPGAWDAASAGLAAVAVLLVVLGPRIHPLFPAVLVAVALGIGVSQLADLGGETVGSVPAGLPPVSLDLPWGDALRLLVPGAVIALVGFAEPASIARTLAALERRRWDADREFVSQGAANVAAAATGGFPVGGSFSRSALNRMAGGVTRWSGAVTGLAVLAFLPAAGVLSPLPTAVLAAIVIAAVTSIVKLGPLTELWRYSRPQFVVAAATFGLTLALSPHVERAVVVGVGLAVAVHLWRELGLELTTESRDGTLYLRPLGVLWFATATRLEDAAVNELAEHRDADRLVIDLGGLGRIDLSGALALRTLLSDARMAGLETELRNVPPHARRIADRVLAEASTGRSPDARG